MKLTCISVLLSLSFWATAQQGGSIVMGKKEIIHSSILNENRTLWIYTPDNTSPLTGTEKRYPVLYILDGEAHFFSTVGIIQQLSQANGNGVLPEMIVVGIENTNRVRDLVPSGKADKPNPFVNFLSHELISYMDSNYNTAPYRVLVGHSLGGLTAIDILTNNPELFNDCIAIDPSMWYDNERFLKNTMAALPKQNMKGNKLFIGTANTMPKGMTLSHLKKDRSMETQHIRSIFSLNEYLKTNTNGLVYAHKYYESERHNTLPLLCEYDGLKFIFDYFHVDLSEKDFADTTAFIASALKAHYSTVSEKMGYQNAAPETLINYLAYDALGKKQYSKAKALFGLNIDWYPNNGNVYDSYGDYCITQKDTAGAIANYKKALQITNNASTLGKLNDLTIPNSPAFSLDYLKQYAGTFTLVEFNIDMKLEIRDAKLLAIVPGQPDSELIPIAENTFTVRGQQGYTIKFKMEGHIPKEFTSAQPNGNFKAVLKTK